jgi:3-oxoacyl-[acyl-carrier protein] reductase
MSAASPASAPTLLVTGGGRGIGRAVALRFARERWNVAVLARSRAELDATCRDAGQAGANALALVADVANEAEVEAATARALERFGAIDVLVNNAGLFRVRPLVESDAAGWRQLLEVNLTGAFLVTRAVVRSMLARPSASGARPRTIVNVSSEAGKKGFAGSTAYCASKYGLCGLGDALREELRPHSIRVINVLPGQVDTRAWDGCGLDLDQVGIRRDRMMRPEEVAEAIAGAVLPTGRAVAEEIALRPL